MDIDTVRQKMFAVKNNVEKIPSTMVALEQYTR